MRKFLARFSYTLLILGGFLFYQVYKFKTENAGVPGWQLVIMLIGGALFIALGSQGIRQRHEMMRRE